MNDLIRALEIFRVYMGDVRNPFYVSHDTLHVACTASAVSKEHREELAEIGFHVDEDEYGFYSFRYGSC